jgi:hypothetical protein
MVSTPTSLADVDSSSHGMAKVKSSQRSRILSLERTCDVSGKAP